MTEHRKGDLLRCRAHLYYVQGKLGAGGMGTCYKGYEHKLGPLKPLAIKLLHPELANDALARDHFEHEGRAMAAFSHPNVVTMYWFDELLDGTPLYVMELLNGANIRHYMKKDGRIELEKALNITIDTLRGLHHAHKHSIVHRDIKPSNVLLHKPLGATALAKVIDFGVMRTVDDIANGFAGTLPYAAPEQYSGGTVGPATDIFGVGAMLYEMLTGAGPFARYGNTFEGAVARANRCPPLVSEYVKVPKPLVTLIDNMLAPRAGERPQSAGRLAEDLSFMTRELHSTPKVYMSEPGRPMRRTQLGATTDPEGADYATIMERMQTGTPEPETAGLSRTNPTNHDLPIVGNAVVLLRDEACPPDEFAPGVQSTRQDGTPKMGTLPIETAVPSTPFSQLATDPETRVPPIESDVQAVRPVYIDSIDQRNIAVGAGLASNASRVPGAAPKQPIASATARVYDPTVLTPATTPPLDPRAPVASASSGRTGAAPGVPGQWKKPQPPVADELRRIIERSRDERSSSRPQPAQSGMTEPLARPPRLATPARPARPPRRRYSRLVLRLRRLSQSYRVRFFAKLVLVWIFVVSVGVISVARGITGRWFWAAESQPGSASVQEGPR